MLEKPPISDQAILSSVQDEYDLPVDHITFLPIGYDVDTAVYRLETASGAVYFLKLRRGPFAESCVRLPQFLKRSGLQAIISPIETKDHRVWGNFPESFQSDSQGDFQDAKLILYPYITGQDGYQLALTDQQWLAFGAAMHTIHRAQVPPDLRGQIPLETFSPHWRDTVKIYQSRVEQETFAEPVAAQLAAFMRDHRDTITHVVERASQLASSLQNRSPEFVLCHADVHPGNLHLTPQGELYIVDWDNPMFALKERDLNLIGGGGTAYWRSTREEKLFYQGYSPDYHGTASPPPEIDRLALSYYRYERIVVDMAEFCNQLFLTSAGGDDRQQSYLYFTGQFLPGHDIDICMSESSQDKAGPDQSGASSLLNLSS